MSPLRILIAIAGIAVAVAQFGCGGDDPSQAELRLIAKANAICADSQQAMKKVSEEFPKGERSDGIYSKIEYAEKLVEVSEATTERLAALDPPQSIRAEYEKYV